MAEKLRNVKVRKSDSDSFDIIGKFHEWGTKTYQLDSGLYFQITVAIVEFEDGEIDLIEPRSIHFID